MEIYLSTCKEYGPIFCGVGDPFPFKNFHSNPFGLLQHSVEFFYGCSKTEWHSIRYSRFLWLRHDSLLQPKFLLVPTTINPSFNSTYIEVCRILKLHRFSAKNFFEWMLNLLYAVKKFSVLHLNVQKVVLPGTLASTSKDANLVTSTIDKVKDSVLTYSHPAVKRCSTCDFPDLVTLTCPQLDKIFLD